MFKLLNNLSIRNRMALSILLFLLTLSYALYDAISTAKVDIDFARQERMGVAYQKPLGKLLYHTALLNAANIAGDKTAFAAHLADIQKEQNEFASVHENYKDALGLTSQKMADKNKSSLEQKNLQTQWDTLSASFATAKPDDIEAGLVAYNGSIKDLISLSGDVSNLTLDPDLDSYYMMDAAVLALPQAIAHLSDANAEIMKFNQKAEKTTADMIALSIKANLVELDQSRIQASIETAISEDKNFYGVTNGMAEAIKPALSVYLTDSKAYVGLLKEMTQGTVIDDERIASVSAKTLDTAYALATIATKEMDHIIGVREETLVGKQHVAIAVSITGVLVSLIFYAFVVLSLMKPLRSLVGHMGQLTSNNLHVDIPYQSAQSEIGEIARAVQVFKQNALENKRLEEEKAVAEERAAADAKRVEEEKAAAQIQAAADKKEAMATLANNFRSRVQGIISSVAAASTELAHTAEAMSKTIYESNGNVQDAVSNTSETYQSVQSVAVSAEEMSATIQEISLQTQNANGLISESVDTVKGADSHANELRVASQKVRSVIQLISNISSQINLLALNATIESARAGEAGKGFAVVANEVRNLAGQTDKSIQEIEKVIADMSNASSDVIGSLGTIKESVDKIYVSSCGIASAVEEQSAVMNDIALNMNLATTKTQMVKEKVTMVGNLSSEAETSSQQVLMAAQDLSRQAEQLDQEVANFLNDIISG